jgi:oligopeptide/dipeptide ABC transporter ATP-binding protein
MTALLEVDGLRVEFALDDGRARRGREPRSARAVDGVSFRVDEGETVAVVGESGSGKTVTALAVMGLVDAPGRITGGDVRLDGRSLVGLPEREYQQLRGREIAMVFQDPMTALNPAIRVGDQVAEALMVHRGALNAHAATTRASELLESVGVPDVATRAREYPHQLSGGLRQRVMLAIALANRPRVLIADEPTTALDVTTQAQILDLLGELRREYGLALVLVTHDLGVVAGLADRVVVMYAGRVVEEGAARELFACACHPYTKGLLASLPQAESGRVRLVPIPGAPPDPAALPPGCAFHPRCEFAVDRCRDAVPDLVELVPGHSCACVRATSGEIP